MALTVAASLSRKKVCPSYDELIYVSNPNTMDADMVKRFLGATELATQFIINNPEESWEIFAGTSSELQDELNAKSLGRYSASLRPPSRCGGRWPLCAV